MDGAPVQLQNQNKFAATMEHISKQSLGQQKHSNSNTHKKIYGESKESFQLENDRVHLAKHAQSVFEIKQPRTPSVDNNSERHLGMTKCETEGALQLPSQLQKKQNAAKKKNTTLGLQQQKVSGLSKASLKFLVKGPVEPIDPLLKKRAELIQELRQSAAKIVVESQEKAKKMTKSRQKNEATQ